MEKPPRNPLPILFWLIAIPVALSISLPAIYAIVSLLFMSRVAPLP
jgi:hypothetical protein